jgi:hypothetical protein
MSTDPPEDQERTAPAVASGGDEPADRPDRKHRIIHARVPEDLDRELKRKALRLGLSVSNLVRNVLQNAFGLVGDIVADSAEVARSARGETPASPPPPATPAAMAVIYGWQELTLAVNAVCERCNALLPSGTAAAIGVTEGPGRRPFLCLDCLKRSQP